MLRKTWSVCPPCRFPSPDTLFLSQFSAAQADHFPPSHPRMLASPVNHLSFPSPARRRRRKSHTSSTARLPAPPSPPFPRKSLPSSPSTVVRLPPSARPSPNLPKEEHLDITEEAAAPVFAVTRASNLFPVYAKSPKRTSCLATCSIPKTSLSPIWPLYHLASWILAGIFSNPSLLPRADV